MALTYDTLTSITRELVLQTQDVVLIDVPLYNYLTSKTLTAQTGGEEIQVNLRYNVTPSDNYNIRVWDGVSDLEIQTTEIMTRAVYPWAHAYRTEKIDRNEWLANQGSERALANLAKLKVQAMYDSLKLGFEQLFWGTYHPTNNPWIGLKDIVSNTDPTNMLNGLGNIKVADAPWWAAQVFTYGSINNSAVTDLRTHMEYIVRKLMKYGKPDLIITSLDVVQKYQGEIYAKEAIITEKVEKWGFTDVVPFSWGIPVVFSDYIPVVNGKSDMYFLNSDFISLVKHPSDWIKFDEWREISTVNKNLLGSITLTGQLICNNRKGLAVLKDIPVV